MASRKPPFLLATLLSCLLCGNALAFGPYQAYMEATSHDPAYLKARADHAVIQENVSISRASLLPSITAESRNTPRNAQSITVRSPSEEYLTFKRRYSSHSASVTLQQPLFDLRRWNQLKQSKAEAEASRYNLMEASQNLMIRVFEAYIEALYAKDQYQIARSQRNAYAEELKRNQSAYRVGDATRTDVAETQAQLLASEVALEDTNDAMLVAMQNLSQITGTRISDIGTIASIKPGYIDHLPQLKAQDIGHWKTLALNNNRRLLQARKSVAEARIARTKAKSEYAPTVSLVAEHTRNTPRTDETLDHRYRTSSIGVAVSIPLYSGGSTNATVRQVNHEIESRMRNAEAITHDIMTNLEQKHRLLTSGLLRITARQRAVKAAQTALTGNRVAVIVGDRVNIDILDATQRLYSARSALNRAVYDNLKAIVYLKYYAGILAPSDIEDIDKLFEG